MSQIPLPSKKILHEKDTLVKAQKPWVRHGEELRLKPIAADKLNHAWPDRRAAEPVCKLSHVSMWTSLSELLPLLRNDLMYMPSEWGHIHIMHDLYQLYSCLNLRTFKLFGSHSYLADWYSNWQFTAIQVHMRTQSWHKYCWAYPIVAYLLLPFNFLRPWGEDHFSQCHISDLPSRHEQLLVSFFPTNELH